MKTSFSNPPKYISPKYKTRAITKKKKNPDVGGEAVVAPNVIGNVDSARVPGTAVGRGASASCSGAAASRRVSFLTEQMEPARESDDTNPPALVEVTEKQHALVEEPSVPDEIVPSNCTEDNSMLSGFLQEPFKTVDLIVNVDDIEKLTIEKEKSGVDYWLSTNFIDFLIKYGIPLFKSEVLLVPTCNIAPLLDLYNSKAKSHKDIDKKFVNFAREK